jgi:threonyl-tRNA synthetase
MLVVGDRDTANQAVSVRLRSGEDLGAMSVADFLAYAGRIVDSKALELQ